MMRQQETLNVECAALRSVQFISNERKDRTLRRIPLKIVRVQFAHFRDYHHSDAVNITTRTQQQAKKNVVLTN